MATIRAAGTVLWREGRDGVEVAVVHRPRRDDWSLPKGKLDPGETEREAAARELEEETGWSGAFGAELGTTRYRVQGQPKTVRYWSVEARAGGFAPNREVDELAWLPPEAARERLTYPRDRAVLDRFLAARAVGG